METTNRLPVISLEQIDPSIATSNELACKIVDAVLSGYINPLDFAVKKKCIEEALESAFNNSLVKDAMIEEAQKCNGRTTHLGAKVEACEVGVKYHFDKCGDPKLKELESQAAEIADQVKQRKDFLKGVDTKGETVLIDSEVVEIFPPLKTSTTSIKVSLKK